MLCRPLLLRRWLVVVALALAATPSFAADLPPAPGGRRSRRFRPSLVTDCRLGVFAHDPWSPENGIGRHQRRDPVSEIRFRRGIAWAVLSPSPRRRHREHGRQDQHRLCGTHMVRSISYRVLHRGARWAAQFTTARRAITGPVDELAGLRRSFRESASLGFRFTPQISVMATVEHYSNAGLCSQIAA